MTGGIGFSRMGSQTSKANRQMLKDVRGKHFKNTGGYKNVKIKEVKADPALLNKIREERLKSKRKNKRIAIITVLLVILTFIYLFMKM